MSVAVCEISGVWWLGDRTPLPVMKLSRLGICSRSDGTFGLSRVKCVLSNWMLMTCWICPLAELSWHPPELATATGAAPPEPYAKAVATTLATAARFDSLRQRLAFTYTLRFQTGSHRHTRRPQSILDAPAARCKSSVATLG